MSLPSSVLQNKAMQEPRMKQVAIGAELATCLMLVSASDVISVKLIYRMVIVVTYFIWRNLSPF
jgi:hypothetical protein